MAGWCFSIPRIMSRQILVVLALAVTVTQTQDAEETKVNYRMTEENEPLKVLGNVAVDAGLDTMYGTEVLEQLRFSFLAQSSIYSEYFSIGEQSGLLEATVSIDRDELCPRQETCDIPLDVSVQPGEYFQIIKVTVTIEDLNDNTPTFPENPVERFLSEASGPGASLTLAPADDRDSPRNNIKSYTQISGLDTFQLRVTNNSDGTVDMQLVLMQELDREENELYEVQIVASDGEKSGTATILIEVRDVNDNNPTFTNQTYETSVFENTPKFTTILKVHASDPDAGSNGEIVYGFTTRTQRDYGDIFNIDETTGEIFVVETLDYEDGAEYVLEVTARDKSADPLPTIAKVKIHVRDLNDHAPQITVNSDAPDGHVEVSEDALIGAFVAHITVIDPDGGDNGRFTCDLDDTSHFRLLRLYDTEFKIVTNSLLDRERQPAYNVAIVCTDQGSTPQASTKRVEIRVADINDHAPVFVPEFYNAIIAENNPIGAPIIQVNATDRDTGPNGEIRYELSGAANELFDINPVTGNITAKVVLDYEQQHSLTITVIAKDQGRPPLSSSATLLLNVQDVDDEAPKFSQETYVFGVEENLPAGVSVGQISATDPDSEPFNFFTFALDQRYNVEGAFRIGVNSGEIFTTRTLDREVQGVYHLVIIATSTGSGQKNTTDVFVSVLDENDNDPVIEFPNPMNNTLYVKQDDPAGHVIGFIVAKDNDTEQNQRLHFNITNGNAEKFFSVDKNTGALLVNGDLHAQVDRQFALVIKVRDYGNPERSAEAILNIVVNQSASTQDGGITSNQNLTIVIAIATVSGFLMVILIIAIVVIIRKQRRNDQKKSNKYNYIPRIVEQHSDNSAVLAPGKVGGAVAASPKKEVSFKTGLDRPDSLNGSFDVSLEKNAMEFSRPEPSSSRPSFTESDVPRQHGGSARYSAATAPPIPHKPWAAAPHNQKASAAAAAGEKDSDSACSADMSNTDSGRGSNDDGSEPFRPASPGHPHPPHWDPSRGAVSPRATPTKEKPAHRTSSINTRALQSGLHTPVPQSQPGPAPVHQYTRDPTYRDVDPTYSHPYLPPRKVPSRTHSHQDPHPSYRDSPTWSQNPITSSSHELTSYPSNSRGYHANNNPRQPQRTDRPDWKLSGHGGGGYYASHV